MSRIGVGVIGLGHNGLAHCECYMNNSKCKLVAVCDINEDRMKFAAEKFGVKGYKDYGILNDNDIQAISINTPDCFHKEPFIKALETGHHVMVEKPMADTLEDAGAMVEAYRKHKDRVVLVGHILRFDKHYEMVKKLVDMGTLGEINYVEGDYIHDLRYQYHQEEWKVNNEIPMVGGGCHPLDLLRWYAGDAIEVTAISNNIAYPEMANDASMIAMFRFKNGAIGKVTALYGNPGPMPYVYNISVYGTKGRIVRGKMCLDGMEEQWLELPKVGNFGHGHPFDPEVDHFLDCILGNKKPLITPEDSYNTIAATLYAVKACKENKMLNIPVKGD